MKSFFKSLWNKETVFVRAVRGALLGLGIGGAGAAAGAVTGDDGSGTGFNATGAVLGFLAGMLGAGEPNPEDR